MKPGKFFIVAFFVPALLCHAQAQDTAGKPAQATAPSPAPASPAPASPAPTSPAAPAYDPRLSPETYVIGAADQISVTVWKEGTLSGGYLVRPDGMISMPLLGDVQASGLTCLQLGDQIETKLKKFLQDPKVTVILNTINSKFIYLLGEVGKKGSIQMTPGMTLLEAIGSAGGLSEYANVKKIYILRDEGGKHEKIPVHYKEALKGDSASNIPMKAGDTIVVP